LENYLIEEGAEPNMAGLMDFALFYIYGRVLEYDMYRIHKKSIHILRLAYKIFVRKQQDIIDAIHKESNFDAPTPFAHTVALAKPYVNYGVKMGEGWLLVAEMVEHIDRGTNNIVITQPFGCLPNHIVAKGMTRVIRSAYPNANITAIDYDPGATRVNQENRIKLMLANARKA
jgi:predicted nucleotide-binding protein (sugar kinase/HSP70/actin superfamily)